MSVSEKGRAAAVRLSNRVLDPSITVLLRDRCSPRRVSKVYNE
jgi:hypothetical protein